MSESENSESLSPGAAADDARRKAVQDDLWAHRIYLDARRKMFASIAGVLAAIAALGLFTVYDLYSDLVVYFEKEAKAKIEERINQRIDEMIDSAGPALQGRLQEATNAAVAEARTKSEALIADARKDADAVKAKLQGISGEVAAATQRLQDFAKAGREPQSQPEISPAEPIATGCNPFALTKDQVALIAILQRVRAADLKTGSERPFFTNNFTLAAKAPGAETLPAAVESCILDAVDRVVYKLSEQWFDPSEVVRIDKTDRFRFEIGVWGSTQVKATVYLKGKQPAIEVQGAFSTQNGLERYLAQSSS